MNNFNYFTKKIYSENIKAFSKIYSRWKCLLGM